MDSANEADAGLYVDDEEDEVFIGPLTSREENLYRNRGSRKTDVFSIKLRESLITYRKGKQDDCELDQSYDSCGKDPRQEDLNDILVIDEEAEKSKVMDCDSSPAQLNVSAPNEVDQMDVIESSFDDMTFYTCYQSIQSGVEHSNCLSTSDWVENLVAPPTSRSSFYEATECEENRVSLEANRDGNDLSPECENRDVDSLEMSPCHLNEFKGDITHESLQIDTVTDTHWTQTSSSDIVDEGRCLNEAFDEENGFMRPETVAQSCQTSFMDRKGTNSDVGISSDLLQMDAVPMMKINSDEIVDEAFDKENQFKRPETLTQSCQTSFINRGSLNNEHPIASGATELKITNPSPFKTPLSVCKQPNSIQKSSSSKKNGNSAKVRSGFASSASPKLESPKFSPRSDKRFNHIVSPISKYINEAPTPPLIVNIRPADVKPSKVPNVMSERVLRSRTTKPSSSPMTVKQEANSSDSNLSTVSDESILERFGLTMEDFNHLEDKSLKRAIQNYIRQEKSSGANKSLDHAENSPSNLIPVANYKGPMALAAVPVRKELDLLTKVTTFRNSKLPIPTPRPVVMKHIGERKKLHWASHVVSGNKNKLKHPGVASPILLNLPQRLDDSCMHNEASMVEVSMVEVAASQRTNTLFRK